MRGIVILFSLLLAGDVFARLPDLIPYRKGHLWGYCDSTKKIIIVPQWDHAGLFTGSCAVVSTEENYGLIDTNGNYVLQPKYSVIDECVIHGLRRVQDGEEEESGMVDVNGKWVIKPGYAFNWEGPYLRAVRKKKMGVFDSTGKVVVPFRYDEPFDLYPNCLGDSGVFPVLRKGNWGAVDVNGNIILPFIYGWVEVEGQYLHAYDGSSDRGEFFTARGQYIANPPRHPSRETATPETLVNGMQAFRGENGLYGFWNAEHQEVIAPKYIEVFGFQGNDLALVTIRKEPGCTRCVVRGYISRNGTEYWEDTD